MTELASMSEMKSSNIWVAKSAKKILYLQLAQVGLVPQAPKPQVPRGGDGIVGRVEVEQSVLGENALPQLVRVVQEAVRINLIGGDVQKSNRLLRL
eukprot:1740191-Pyramimonas_sp.AAC.1